MRWFIKGFTRLTDLLWQISISCEGKNHKPFSSNIDNNQWLGSNMACKWPRVIITPNRNVIYMSYKAFMVLRCFRFNQINETNIQKKTKPSGIPFIPDLNHKALIQYWELGPIKNIYSASQLLIIRYPEWAVGCFMTLFIKK